MKLYINSLRKSALLLAGLSLLAFTSCNEDTDPVANELEGTTTLTLDARFGEADFELNKSFQATAGDQTLNFQFSRLRYWVSNVTLIDDKGAEYLVPNSYYLMEETGEIPVQDGTFGKVYPANKREDIQLEGIPSGNYTAIKFNIGVEPKYNDNLSIRVGELNALNGMASASWMWFTSYIFTSTAGKMALASDAAQTQNFFWETGSNDMLTEKRVEFAQAIKISSATASSIALNLDVKEVININGAWDNGVIGATKVELMTALRDNYVEAISIKAASSTAK